MPALNTTPSEMLSIIDAIDHASARELKVLTDIHRVIVGRSSLRPNDIKLQRSNASIITQIARRQAPANESTSPLRRNQLHDIRNNNGRIELIVSGGGFQINDKKSQKSPFTIESGKVTRGSGGNHANLSNLQSKNTLLQQSNSQSHAGRVLKLKGEIENHYSEIGNAAKKLPFIEEDKTIKSSIKHDVAKGLAARDKAGRFISKDTVEKTGGDGKKSEEQSLLKRLSSLIVSKRGDGEATEVAGMAAGGVLFSAGKEAAELVSGLNDKVVSLKEWRDKRKDQPGSTSQTPVTFAGVTPTKSQQAYSTSTTGKVISVMESQQEQLAKSDAEIIRVLGEIRDKNEKGSAGRGLLGSVLAGLGGKAIGKAIGSRILGGLSLALGGGVLVKLFRRLAGASDVGDVIRTGRGALTTGGVHGERKPSVPAGKGKGSKIAKVAAGAGAVAAGAYGAIKGVFGVNGEAGELATPVTESPQKSTNSEVESRKQKKSGKRSKRRRKVSQSRASAKANEKVAAKASTASAEHAAEKVAGEKVAEKAAGKLAAKGALKAIPVVGTIIGAGIDAVEGFSNDDGQRGAFKLAEGQEVPGRQKTEYAAANVIDMGGLVSGGAGFLADGARWLGMDGVADSLTFSTDGIAESLDSGVSSVKESLDSGISSVKEFFGTSSDSHVEAIRAGAKQTTEAIKDLDRSLQSTMPGMAEPLEDQSGTPGSVPTFNNVSSELNIGGVNSHTRSFRNNNFGNLEYAGQAGAELEAANAKGERRFAKFDSPEEGFRALANQLSSYAEGTSKAVGYQKLNTVRGIITNYAPKGENDTEGYIAQLSKTLRVRESDRLDLSNADVMTKVMRQIATIEGGAPQVSDQFIKTAIGARSGRKWVGQFNPETLSIINQQRQNDGLEAITNNAQFSRPEKQTIGSRVSEAASEAYDTAATYLGELGGKSDAALTGMFDVEGLTVPAPERGLTVPLNDKVPTALQGASGLPDAIAVLQGRASRRMGYTGLSDADIELIPPPTVSGAQERSMEIVPANEVKKSRNKMSPPGNSETDSWWDETKYMASGIGNVAIGAVKGVGEDAARSALQSIGVDIDNPLSSFGATAGDTVGSGASSLISGLMADTPLSFLSDTVSNAIGGKANTLTQQVISAFQTSPPPPIPNLAASGVAPVYQRDNESRSHDDESLSWLERIAKGVEKQLNVKPEPKETNINMTAHSPQPAPRGEVPTSISDSALEKLFG
ncbi:hypothetical protein SAMN02744783_04797 [Serratia sp. CC22-02]|uniref:hypothetical protein n=1 Tax=Serratia sp. CC22-02 TaxID=1378076 RepID=UPI002402E7D2|nr:hypothetical protein [Serratia sp. CC22-02]SMP81048.1 hypothetical protein SAMN02744783_04797 [Serratia sp. CC22-02]